MLHLAWHSAPNLPQLSAGQCSDTPQQSLSDFLFFGVQFAPRQGPALNALD